MIKLVVVVASVLVSLISGCSTSQAKLAPDRASHLTPDPILAKLVGDWRSNDGTLISRTSTLECGGLVLVTREVGKRGAEDVSSLQLLRYDGEKNAMKLWIFNSRGRIAQGDLALVTQGHLFRGIVRGRTPETRNSKEWTTELEIVDATLHRIRTKENGVDPNFETVEYRIASTPSNK